MRSGQSRFAAISAIFVILTIIFAAATVYEATKPAVVSTTTSTSISTSTSTNTVTVTTYSTAAVPSILVQVNNTYGNHLFLFGANDMTALLGDYEKNANVTYEGYIEELGLVGNYSGTDKIGLLFQAWVSGPNTPSFSIANESNRALRAMTTGSGNIREVVVNSTFGVKGFSLVVGDFNGTVSAQTTYAPQDANDTSWLIAYENWNFTSFWIADPSYGAYGP